MAKPQLDALVRKNGMYLEILALSPRAKERLVSALPENSLWKCFRSVPMFLGNWHFRQLADKNLT